MTYAECLERARRDVEQLDQIDRFRDRQPATILAALEAGLRDPTTNAQFEAYVMMEDWVRMIKQMRDA